MLKDIEWETCEHRVFKKHTETYGRTVGYCCWDKRGPWCKEHDQNCIWQHIPKALFTNEANMGVPTVICMDIAQNAETIRKTNPRSAPLFESFEYIPFTIRNDQRSRLKAGTYYDRTDYGKEWYIWLSPEELKGKTIPASITVRFGIPYRTHIT